MKTYLAALLLLASSGSAFAQATGTINGRVLDQGSLAAPGATVTATNTATGVVRTTVTNERGLYSIPALQPGTYDIKVELRSEEHTSELQSHHDLVCRLL